jgi:hypothetical protein
VSAPASLHISFDGLVFDEYEIPSPDLTVLPEPSPNSFFSPHESLKEDVAWLRQHPLIHKETIITGLVFDEDAGTLERAKA